MRPCWQLQSRYGNYAHSVTLRGRVSGSSGWQRSCLSLQHSVQLQTSTRNPPRPLSGAGSAAAAASGAGGERVQPWQQMFGNQGEAANSLSAESLTQASGAVVWPDLSAGTTPAAGPQQPGLPVPGGNPASSSSVEESSPAQVGVPVYGQPGTQAAAPVYGQPPTLGAAPVYGQSYTQGAAPAYGQPSTEVAALTYGQDPTQAPGYGQPFAQAAAPGYGQYSTQAPVPTYGQPASQAGAPAYGQPSTQAAAPGYGQPSPVGPTAYDAPGYTSPQSGPVDAGLPLPAVAYSQDANNMVRLSGTLAVEPRFVIDNGRSYKVEIIICPFGAPGSSKYVTQAIMVDVWGDLAKSVLGQLHANDTVAVVATLGVDARQVVRTTAGPAIRVTAVSVARVEVTTIPSDVKIQPYEGLYPTSPPGRAAAGSSSSSSSSSRDYSKTAGGASGSSFTSKYTSLTAEEDLAAWCAGTSLHQLMQLQGYKLSAAVVSVLQGLQLAAGSMPAGSFDWQRLLGELNVSSALLAAIKEGMVVNSTKLDKKGRVLMSPVRAFLLRHPVVGSMVAQQEAAAGQDPTFAQIQAVRRGVAAGAL